MLRDDRILPETRALAAVLVPILLITGVILYGWPGDTDKLFAWTIMPRMTPLLMGAGYLSGVYFYLRVALGDRWHRVGTPLLGVSAFAILTAVATAVHWDRFNHRHVAFYFWLLLYALVPILFPLFWWRNRKTDPGAPEPDDLAVPRSVRIGLGLISLGVAVAVGVVFVHPQFAIDHWPWKVTPLTARVIAAWMAVPAVTGVAISLDRRWSSWRVVLEWDFLWAAGIGIGMLRARGDLIHGRTLTPVAVVVLVLWITSVMALYGSMVRRQRRLGHAAQAAIRAGP